MSYGNLQLSLEIMSPWSAVKVKTLFFKLFYKT